MSTPFDIDSFLVYPRITTGIRIARTVFKSGKIYFRQWSSKRQHALVCLLVYNLIRVSYITAFAFRITKQSVNNSTGLLTVDGDA